MLPSKKISQRPIKNQSKSSEVDPVPVSTPELPFDKEMLEQMRETSDLSEEDFVLMENMLAIGKVIEQWREAAKAGNAKAVVALCGTVKHALMGLEGAGEENVKAYASGEVSWPVLMIPDSPAWVKTTQQYLTRIGVGSNSRPGQGSRHLVKTPREIKDVAALLYRFAQLSGDMYKYANGGTLLKKAASPHNMDKNARLGGYLIGKSHLLFTQLRQILHALCKILELPPDRDVKEFMPIAFRCAQLPELSPETFTSWFNECINILVLLTDDGFMLSGSKLRPAGSAKNRSRMGNTGAEKDSSFREGIIEMLRDALRSVVGIPRPSRDAQHHD